MSNNYTAESDLKASKETIPQEDHIYFFRHSWLKDLGPQRALLFSVIEKLSCKFGYCFMSNDGLARELSTSPRNVERWLKELEDLKWIFRNTYSIHKGSKRYIVTKHHVLAYWNKSLNKPSVPDRVKKRFLSHFMGIDTPHILTESPTLRNNVSSYELADPVDSLLLRNNLKIKEKAATKGAAAFSDELKEALIKRKRSEDDIEQAMAYLKTHPEIEHKTANPIGWFIKGFEQGWLYDKILGEASGEVKKQKLWDENKKQAEELKQKHAASAEKAGLKIDTCYKYIEFVMVVAQAAPIVLTFDDPRFSLKLEQTKIKFHLE